MHPAAGWIITPNAADRCFIEPLFLRLQTDFFFCRQQFKTQLLRLVHWGVLCGLTSSSADEGLKVVSVFHFYFIDGDFLWQMQM